MWAADISWEECEEKRFSFFHGRRLTDQMNWNANTAVGQAQIFRVSQINMLSDGGSALNAAPNTVIHLDNLSQSVCSIEGNYVHVKDSENDRTGGDEIDVLVHRAPKTKSVHLWMQKSQHTWTNTHICSYFSMCDHQHLPSALLFQKIYLTKLFSSVCAFAVFWQSDGDILRGAGQRSVDVRRGAWYYE